MGKLRPTLLIILKKQELGPFPGSLVSRIEPECALIRNGLLSTKFLPQVSDKFFIDSKLLLQLSPTGMAVHGGGGVI